MDNLSVHKDGFGNDIQLVILGLVLQTHKFAEKSKETLKHIL